MSATVAVVPEKTTKKYVTAWDLWGLILPLLAMSPLLLVQFQKLMNRPERQFFPILIAICLYFPIRQILTGSESGAVTRQRLSWTLGIFITSSVLFIMSAWTFSPWLAHVAALGIFLAWGLAGLLICHGVHRQPGPVC